MVNLSQSTGGVDTPSGADPCCRFLQTLVAIRLRTVSDPEARRHLAWISDMAAAVALMSERQAAGDPFDLYVEDALAFWRRALATQGVRLEIRGRVGELPEAQRLPLAVVLHELLSNAARHGFVRGAAGGAVAVAFSAGPAGLNMVVRDTGIGAAEARAGDGLSLVEGLVGQLGGSMTLETAPGAGFGVRISLPSGAGLLN